MISFINGNGERVQCKYDLLGRLIEQALPTGEKTTFAFDQNGRMLAAVNPDAEVKFEYDLAGRLICEFQNDHWVRTEYNLTGEVVRTSTSLNHEVKYELDPNGRVIKLTTAKDQSLSFELDARGLEIGREMPGDMRLEQSFDSMGRLIGQRVGRKGYRETPTSLGAISSRISPYTDRIQRNYSYDNDGLLLTIKDEQWGKTEYGYDPAERLVRALRDKGISEQFEFDSTDNLTRMHHENDESNDIVMNYSTGNRIQRRGNMTYEHDSDGRIVRKVIKAATGFTEVWEFELNHNGQIRLLRRPDGQIWRYKYDAFGRRTAKIGPDSTVTFIWDRDAIIHEEQREFDSISWVVKRDSFSMIAKVCEGELCSIVTDHLGSTREMLSPKGEVVLAIPELPLGTHDNFPSARFSFTLPTRFQGQWHDQESGLSYNRFRYYDSEIARYLTQDSIGLAGGLNLYSYSVDTVNWIDPFGLAKKQCENLSDENPIPKEIREQYENIKLGEVYLVLIPLQERRQFFRDVNWVQGNERSGKVQGNLMCLEQSIEFYSVPMVILDMS